MAIDTLKVARRLRDAGFSETQAEAVVVAVQEGAEGVGSNLFIVRDGVVLTPHERWVLPGVSRAMAIELCGKLGIPCREADLDLYDASTADEAFMTSTSLCLCPVRSIGGRALPIPLPGPITRRLSEAYAREVDCDFIAQYLAHLA